MTSKSTRSISKTINTLEKNRVKVRNQLLKARSSKIKKLDKALASTKLSLKKQNSKLTLLKVKKSAAAERQKVSLKASIIEQKSTLNQIKMDLFTAKQTLKNEIQLERVIATTQKQIEKNKQNKKKPKKRVLTKKAIKKTLKKNTTHSELTPDLSIPVTAKTKKNTDIKKAWTPAKVKKQLKQTARKEVLTTKEPTPKIETKLPKQEKETVKRHQQIVDAEKDIKPILKQEKPTSNIAAKENREPLKEKEDTQEKNILKDKDNGRSKVEVPSKPEKAPEQLNINWHTMPIIKIHED